MCYAIKTANLQRAGKQPDSDMSFVLLLFVDFDALLSLLYIVTGTQTFSVHQNNLILIGCVLITLPACLAKDLHALRHMCYVGFFSVFVLTAAIAYR